MSQLKLSELIHKKKIIRASHSTNSLIPQNKIINSFINDKPHLKKVKILKESLPKHAITKQVTLKNELKNVESLKEKEDCLITNNSLDNSSENYNAPSKINNLKHLLFNSHISCKVKSESESEYLYCNQLELANKSENSDEEEERIRDENEIKKLTFWEIEHFVANNNSNPESEKSSKSQNVSKTESLNFIKEVKENIEKLRLKKTKQLQEFNKKTDEEQATILMQNIKLTKKKFDFKVFCKSDLNKERSKAIEKNLKHNEKLNLNESGSNGLINQNLFQENDIKLKLVGGFDSFRNPDQYREIIKNKTKLENSHRFELMKLSQKIYDIKKQKYKLNAMISDCTNYLYKIQNIFNKEKELIEIQKEEAERIFQNQIIEQEFDYSKNPSQKRKVISSSSDEFMTIKNEFQRKMDTINSHLEKTTKNYNKEKSKFTLQMLEHKKNHRDLETEIKNLKTLYNTLAQEQRVYYIDIIKKGIDVRFEGLSWAIKRLIELNAHLDYTIFPRFLDHSQIDYLLKVYLSLKKLSYKQVESGQFKILLKALKTRQKSMREKENTELMKNSKISFNSTSSSNFLFSAANNSLGFNKTSFSHKTLNHFDQVFKKYDKLMKITYEQRIEDINIQSVVEELRKKLKFYHKDNIIFDDKSTSNIQMFFDENKKQKEYFEEILLLRQKIEEVENEISLLKEEALRNFKKKYDNLKILNNKFSIQYDLIHSALFGNSIIL